MSIKSLLKIFFDEIAFDNCRLIGEYEDNTKINTRLDFFN